MRIAFCTALTAATEAFPSRSLDALRGTPHVAAVADLSGSHDGVSAWSACIDDIRRGTLIAFRGDGPEDASFGAALNAAHRLGLRAEVDVLCRMDAGQDVTPATIRLLEEAFAGPGDVVLHNWSKAWAGPSMGRIALTPANWIRLGGYDEEPAGRLWLSVDLLVRARAAALRYEQSDRGLEADASPGPVDPADASRTGADSFVAVLGRTRRLSLASQRRLPGRLSTGEQVTI